MSKLLIALIGTVATISVAAAATLIGIQFAPTPHLKTESAPVLAPLRVDGQATAASGTGNLSPVVGQTTVVTPGQKGTSPIGAQAQRQIDALDAADGADPGHAQQIVGGAGATPATPADDPCSPSSGAPSADCPDGIHGAVFADTDYGTLIMLLRANPPHAQRDSVFNCPPATPGSGEIPIDVITNIPSDVTVNYWPADGSAPEHTVVLPGAASDLATWNSYYRAHGNTYDYNEFYQHCFTLTGIRANTDYVASVVAVDTFGRTSDPVLGNFTSRAAPTIPPMMVLPLTNSVVYASVPFQRGGAQPIVKAWVVAPGTPADCSSYDQTQQELRVTQAEGVYQVSADYLRANNYTPNWDQRLVDVFEVPEGTTVVICARTFGSSGPTWDRTRPTSQQFVRLQSPDAAVPIVTLKRLHLLKAVSGDDISFTGTTQFGSYCGGAFSNGMTEPSAPTAAGTTMTVNRVLCDSRESSRAATAAVGVTGNIVVTTNTYTPGHNYTAVATLPLSRYACTGACPTLPPTLDYAIPLASPAPYRPIVSCSDPSGCSYPPTANQTGSADLEVTWVRGRTNGLAHWAIGLPDNTLTPPAAPDTPQLDVAGVPAVTLSVDGHNATATLHLSTDRHVRYFMTVWGDCFLPGAARTVSGQTTPTVTGSPSTATQDLIDLCPGSSYQVTIALTDDHGHFSTYSAEGAVDWAHTWSGLDFTTPYQRIRIDATFSLTSPGGYYKAWGSTGIDFAANGSDSHYAEPFPIECFQESTLATGFHNLGKSVTIPLAQSIHLNVQSAAVQEDLYGGRNLDAHCAWTSQTWAFQNIITDVSYNDLSRGVTLEAPRSATQPFTLSMHVWATNIGVLPRP